MNKIIYNESTISQYIKLNNSEIESVKNSNISKTGVRIIGSNDLIGTSGGVGKVDIDYLEEKALDNMILNIKYPSNNDNSIVSVDDRKKIFDNFYQEIEDFTSALKNTFTEYSVSNTISIDESKIELKNSYGMDLLYRGNQVSLALLFKKYQSANVFDNYYEVINNYFDKDLIIADLRALLAKYDELSIEDGKYGLLLNIDVITSRLERDLNADYYASHASFLSGLRGSKVMNSNLSLKTDMGKNFVNVPFFDMDGSFNEDRGTYLIKNGILITPYTNLKQAKTYALDNTMCATGEYDSVPLSSLNYAYYDETISLPNNYIMPYMLTGIEYKDSGDFTAIINLGYVIENNEIIGTISNYMITGNIVNMLNDDFVGVCNKSFLKYQTDQMILINLEIKKVR